MPRCLILRLSGFGFVRSLSSCLTITMQFHAQASSSHLLLPQSHTPLTLPSARFTSSVLPSPKSKFRNRLLVVRCCISSDDELPSLTNGFSPLANKLFIQEAIGAEYGEGFETFRQDGPLKVDVDFLNEKLQEGFLQRIRYAMKPDEAYGLIFSWDNVVADTRSQKASAWTKLASEEGIEIPDHVNTQKMILQSGAGQKLLELLGKEESELDRLKLRLSQLYHENLLTLSRPIDGLPEWLDAVSTARIPCGIVSCLDRKSMMIALEKMGLHKYFKVFVTEEDGMESMAHKFLSASMKLDRKPSKCVVFEDDPRGITAAHNCTMMAVALIGAHPAYELVQADLAVASFCDLSVINLRRLFAHKGSGFMELQKQIIGKSPTKRKLNIDTIL